MLIARPVHQLTFTVLMVAVGSFALLQSLVVPVLGQLEREFDTNQTTVTWVLTARRGPLASNFPRIPTNSRRTRVPVAYGAGGDPDAEHIEQDDLDPAVHLVDERPQQLQAGADPVAHHQQRPVPCLLELPATGRSSGGYRD